MSEFAKNAEADVDPVNRFVTQENSLHEDGCEYPNAECTCVTPPAIPEATP